MHPILKTITDANLVAALSAHALWLDDSDTGARLDLSGHDLRGHAFALTRANLTRANLDGAILDGANLDGVNLTRANLYGASLYGASLYEANLDGANLYGANLTRAGLDGADLDRIVSQRAVAPQVGAFDAFKKVKRGTNRVAILHLRIPAKAQRVGGTTDRKCRASEVKVLGATTIDGTKIDVPFESLRRDGRVTYEVGKTVTADKFDPDPLKVCAGGIHFFMTRAEAAAYEY